MGLLHKIGQGDQTALGALYDATSRLVYGMALRVVSDPGVAEEVTLEVYMQVWRQPDKFDPGRGRFSAWLLTITRSRAIDRLRSSRQELMRREPLDAVADFSSTASNPEESAVLAQQCHNVRQALCSLTPEQRQAIELAYFRGLSQSEIATRLDQPLGTVKTRIRSGMLKLRELLQPLEGGI